MHGTQENTKIQIMYVSRQIHNGDTSLIVGRVRVPPFVKTAAKELFGRGSDRHHRRWWRWCPYSFLSPWRWWRSSMLPVCTRLAILKMMMKKSQTMRKMEICLTKVWKMENILTDIKKLAEYKVNSWRIGRITILLTNFVTYCLGTYDVFFGKKNPLRNFKSDKSNNIIISSSK